MTRSVAIGLGCRKGVPCDAVVALIRAAIDRLSFAPEEVHLYSSERKLLEPGLIAAAVTLGFDLTFLPEAALADASHRLTTRSPKVREIAGVDSVAEAAALAGGGPGASLLIPRFIGGGVACAIATVTLEKAPPE